MYVKIVTKEETKKYTTFYLYINGSQAVMTLKHKAFAELCGLLSKGQWGLPLDEIEIEQWSYLK